MKPGDEVIYTRTRCYRGLKAGTFEAVVIDHTGTRVRLQAGRWKGTVSYRNVKPKPVTSAIVIDARSERPGIDDAMTIANLTMNLEIESVRFVDPEVVQ